MTGRRPAAKDASMQNEVKFAGFGGQGILLSAKILAHAALEEGQEVVWIPSYGPEMRGGTAYCTVVIGDRPIGSPIIKNPRYLIAMNRPSLEKFASTVKPGGIVLINANLIPVGSGRDDVTDLVVPVNDLAAEAGNLRAANLVALAAFVARSGIVDFETLRRCVQEEFVAKPQALAVNMAALDKGRQAAAE
jgi:2-oxoglutarate ferredoxin oxidoreductase subunit gamma